MLLFTISFERILCEPLYTLFHPTVFTVEGLNEHNRFHTDLAIHRVIHILFGCCALGVSWKHSTFAIFGKQFTPASVRHTSASTAIIHLYLCVILLFVFAAELP